MQLMCDAISVLGSRHGVLWNPIAKECGIIRFGPFDALPKLEMRAGIIIGGKEYLLPLCHDGGQFQFCDQRLSSCTMTLMGIDGDSATKLKLTVAAPFRPRDLEFSTTPVLAMRLTATSLGGGFRWHPKTVDVQEAEIFIEFAGADIRVEESGADTLDLVFNGGRPLAETGEQPLERDRLVALTGLRSGKRFTRRVTLAMGEDQSLDIAWCAHSEPVLEVHGTKYPFKYAEKYPALDAVCAWARQHPTTIFDNAATVDGIIANNNCSQSINHLLAQTLHSWLIDTWCVDRNGSDWFSVWEGSCYFHSTVDVEYTQSPFYLAVWPELLRSELDFWPEYSKDGALTLGERGHGTLFLSHDTGVMTTANGQVYPHEMEVEETTNYIILAYAYYKRTGDDTVIRKHAGILEQYLAFVAACDTTGNGIPDKGVANTIDDASPAVQFGEEQVYLAVKVLAAYATGTEMLDLLGNAALADRYRELAARVRIAVEESGWQGDHYATLLKKSGTIVDAWAHTSYACEEIPGWDAAHIYTVNGIALLDMVGFDLGLDHAKLLTDLAVATERCLREYGCIHSDYMPSAVQEALPGLIGASRNPGWVSMNMLRDIAAFYRGVDLRHLADRYWEWQTTTNTQEPKIFFETFNGNNLCFYPRGIAIWGYFDALAGRVIDKVAGVDRASHPIPGVKAPKLLDVDWTAGVRVGK